MFHFLISFGCPLAEIQVIIFSYIVSNLRDGFNRPKVVTYWLGRLRDPRGTRVTLSEEHVAFKWVDLEAACELAQRDGMRRCLRQCQEHIMAMAQD